MAHLEHGNRLIEVKQKYKMHTWIHWMLRPRKQESHAEMSMTAHVSYAITPTKATRVPSGVVRIYLLPAYTISEKG
nr:MAG TPA: hypothetical protein [Caudoviricetes sp.]